MRGAVLHRVADMSDAKKRAALPDGRRAEFPKEELETWTFIAPRTSYGCPFKCRHGGIHWSALAVACPYIQMTSAGHQPGFESGR